MWITGEKVELRRPYSDFSKSNWGDSGMESEGKTVSIPTTTNFLSILEKLKDKPWA